MTLNLKKLLPAALTFAMALPMVAQDIDLLQEQRLEDQRIVAVPGRIVNHHGIVINPTPRSITADKKNRTVATSVLKAAKVKANVGTKAARKAKLPQVEGAYMLAITPKGVEITAADKVGDYYARQTLNQILQSERAFSGTLPCITVTDWPELEVRGVVEGYYGEPWSHKARLAMIDFYGKNKLNTYIYGPKNDPYHTSPNWRKPYPEADANHLKELIDSCNSRMVKFVWAAHPGADIKWNEQDFADIMAKFEQLYSLGCRAFAIFFDDIRGEGTNPHKQSEFLNRLNAEFVQAKGDVAPLAMCPSDFTRAWADGSENGALAVYGRELDPSVKVMWTGDAVCCDIPRSTLQWTNERTGRPALVWWNYPVTDYARHILLQGPVYGLDTANTANDLSGLVSNPMEHGIASLLALYGVADYTWNPTAYNPIDNWHRGMQYLMPECPDAYKAFAINSCDTEYGYRRAESWEIETFALKDYTNYKAARLLGELNKMLAAPEIIRSHYGHTMLVKEMNPWLDQLQELAERTITALNLAGSFPMEHPEDFWPSYINNLMDSTQIKAYEAHKVGTQKWQPFYESLMDQMVDEYYKSIAGVKASIPTVIGTFGNIGAPMRRKMFDNDPTTVFFADRAQQDGDFIGIDMGSVMPLTDVTILHGRNASDPVRFPLAVLESSVDGKNWTALTGELSDVYEITWNAPEGTQAPMARYVRLRKLPKDRSEGVGIAEFVVNRANVTNGNDRNPSTFDDLTASATAFSYPMKADATEVVLLLGAVSPDAAMTCTITDAAGKELATRSITDVYASFALPHGAATIILGGNGKVYEVISR